MDEYTFKHCPKGHYYQGDECPYCKRQEAPFNDALEDCPFPHPDVKVCPRGHAYSIQLNRCPYCGEIKIVRYWDMRTAWLCSLIITFMDETIVQVDGISLGESTTLEIDYVRHRYISGYTIAGASPINYKSVIQIGTTVFSGKEFINWVDCMLNVKKIENHQ